MSGKGNRGKRDRGPKVSPDPSQQKDTPRRKTRNSTKQQNTPEKTELATVKESDRHYNEGSSDNSTPKKQEDSIQKLLPEEYESMMLCKALYDIADSIYSCSKHILGNKKVKSNFIEADEIFKGYMSGAPQKSPKQTPNGKKRKHSRQNAEEIDERTHELEEKIQRLEKENEELVKKSKDDQKTTVSLKVELQERNKEVQALSEQIKKIDQELSNERDNKLKEQENKAVLLKEKHVLDTNVTNLQGINTGYKQNIEELEGRIETKNEELESLSNELQDKISFFEKKKHEFTNELKSKNEEINDLKTRLSALSASRLDGDPNIADLGDPNRPLKLVEKYQQLYDNQWTDVFYELTESYCDIEDEKEKEKKAAFHILSIVQELLEFCKTVIEDQERTIGAKLMLSDGGSMDGNNSAVNISSIRSIRKSIGEKVVPHLVKVFMEKDGHRHGECMSEFVEECIKVCWLCLIQDPPMAFEFDYCKGTPLDRERMREFTVSGDCVNFVVWPTLRLHTEGPIMVKSVVQPMKNCQ